MFSLNNIIDSFKSNVILTNFYTTFLQTVLIANFYWFTYGPITYIIFFFLTSNHLLQHKFIKKNKKKIVVLAPTKYFGTKSQKEFNSYAFLFLLSNTLLYILLCRSCELVFTLFPYLSFVSLF